MLKNTIFPCALLVMSHSAFAQQIPTAGSQMQQIPPAPVPNKTAPKVELRQAGAPAAAAADSMKITVNRLQVTGTRVYSEAQLLALTGFRPGSVLTLEDLRGMAAKIADHFHRNGYFVAQAYLPAQDIKDGIVTIAVIDGRYGKVTLNNQTNLSGALAGGLLGGLNNGDLIDSVPLESRLLLLSDIPGVKVTSTLIPGASVGASDLIVELTPGQRVSGSVDADNAGNRYTGQYRVGATVNLNDPTGNGDVASLRVLTSGAGLNYARASYQIQAGKAKVGVAYSYLRYALGREFDSLDANGTAKVASIYANYPLIRSRNNNLYTQLAYDDKTFQDKVDATSSVTDKKARVLMASLYGDHRDELGGGGMSSYSLTLFDGELDLQTPSARTIDALTAHSNGHYNKVSLNAMRLQHVTDAVSLYASVSGQAASKNLDVSEKMELGGMYAVRAYPEGEAYADQGYLLTLEARLDLPRSSAAQQGQLQLIGFVDSGSVTLNKNPWTSGSNHRTLSGAGIGLNWTDNRDNFVVRAYYAHKLGNAVATSAPDSSGRFWIQAVKYF
ncbi:MAG: ShlB/FhaC/HecB family hemolysin secretion/activation protein [Pseudomonadota bacterium]|nr:ShlB/FhaC/HecB family hemolysin secretion/activation protein [Pseudomonadota bacterium]